MQKKYKVGFTTGVFDLFHLGHLNILKKSKEACEFLIVGVNTDELTFSYKKKHPIIPFEERIRIVEAIKYVDSVIPVVHRDKVKLCEDVNSDVIFVGDDWKNTPLWNTIEKELSKLGIDVKYFPYTEGTSSTILREVLNKV